ncbi:intersectin-1 isoform X1 [Anopheles darlingi]|uniref:intersectin-1 isoform X1 n=1 Tax=Anopheles darlingi TaxID=43151 RepID=UPI00210041C8|nr:intersectin-1 isoform X1 [Anopheles darlingi]XP_049549100.1 intersectin-1 isoform X1 [Anopheles darlingi]XP_049549101.1 intersectin-1 isoform X1 [Anopheles darlingi]XP_049549102.1 intersectin-1 isoform X1 [Anopheles darlingi]XP_049549103.1 intersectin-1 isoform X1 [Anopheles darlingi]XP_049549104.1 intersectin-1 isoform X1 [Anopheles darlingi]
MNAADPFVITSRERLKYDEQFKSLQPVNGVVTGGQAKGFFLQSQLPPQILGQIWALADTDADGRMTLGEFSIACKLINLKLRGFEIPKVLPPTLIASLTAVGGTPTLTPTTGLSPLDPLKSLAGSIGGPTAIVPPVVAQQPLIGAAAPGIVPHAIVPPLMNNHGLGGVAAPSAVGLLSGGVPPPKPAIPPQPLIATGGAPPLIPLGGVQPQLMGAGLPMMSAAGGPVAAPPVVMSQQPLIGGILSGPPIVPPTVAGGASVGIVKPLIDPLVGGIGGVSQPLIAGMVAPVVPTASVPAPPTPPSGGGTPARSMSISERAPSIDSPGQVEWAIKGPAKLKYTQLFNTTDRNRSGYLTGPQARNIMVQTKLPQATLAQIWALADMDTDGRLGCEEFVLAMYLCDLAATGEKIPTTLPPDLVPPSFRKPTSRHGSLVGSRHGSVSSQGGGTAAHAAGVELDPLSGLPMSSFEDKRKENFDKGQAELERRRKALMDIQKKEQEERERKEREEQEKIRKAKLEAELKKQQEHEKELQRQRELEQEREEQRKRELEKKELARKELEKQRQQEWEAQKISEMQQHRQREQENVLKLKAQNQSLSVELSTFNERIKEMSQKICDTRVGVTTVKTTIDGMRATRDSQMAEMAQLKSQVKDQNQRLVQLSQEKAKLDAKNKTGETESQLQFTNKQIVIQQLKDKLENTKQQIENKSTDINLNREQLTELKAQLTGLIDSCEKLYGEYDMQRIQILEMKNNRKNESYSTSTWDTGSSWATADTTAIATTNEPLARASVPVDSLPTPPGYVKYRAIYEFSARNGDEISFQPGDIVMVPLEQNAEPGWLAGEIDGHTGWFPETYVEKVDNNLNVVEAVPETIAYGSTAPTEDYAATAVSAPATEYTAANDTTVEATCNGDVEYYVACYAYQSAEVGDLVFDAGETIAVSKKEGDWWTGTIGNRTGIFPSNYVTKHDGGGAEVTNGNQPMQEQLPEQHTEIEALQRQQQQQATYEQEAKRKQSTTGNTQDAEDARNQAEADSEVSQINTQPPQAPAANEENIRYSSMSMTSATPSLRRKGEVAQVIAPYEATSSEQLSLQRGQLIMIRKKTDSGWWEGELQAKGRRRQIGWFPATYVKVLQGGRNSGRNTPVSASKVELTETILDKVIALYPYKALNDDELSFDKDDIISVLGRDEPEWWRGELNGTTGLFPSNYVGPFVSSGKHGKASTSGRTS